MLYMLRSIVMPLELSKHLANKEKNEKTEFAKINRISVNIVPSSFIE